MSELIPFSYESHVLRVEPDVDGEPIFHANDLCALLGYKNPRDAVRRHVEEDDVVKRDVIDSLGRTQMANWVREPGMWSLILGSETEQAKRIKRWVTSEVLPQIRKTGGYQVDPDTIAIPKDEYIALLETQVAALKAKTSFQPGPRAWTEEEDRQLIELRRQGLGFTRIGYRLGRSESSCKHRWQRLSLRHAAVLEQQGEMFTQGGAA